jgi:hypothetical protein
VVTVTGQLLLFVACSLAVMALVVGLLWWTIASAERKGGAAATHRAALGLNQAGSQILRTLLKAEIRATSIRMRRELDRELSDVYRRRVSGADGRSRGDGRRSSNPDAA